MHQLQTNKRTIIKVAQGTKIFSYSINNKNEKIREKGKKGKNKKKKKQIDRKQVNAKKKKN